jgi:hypothetical protein
MTAADVVPQLGMYQGLFVGGSLAWKLETSARWVQLAHGHGMRCHIGPSAPLIGCAGRATSAPIRLTPACRLGTAGT